MAIGRMTNSFLCDWKSTPAHRAEVLNSSDWAAAAYHISDFRQSNATESRNLATTTFASAPRLFGLQFYAIVHALAFPARTSSFRTVSFSIKSFFTSNPLPALPRSN